MFSLCSYKLRRTGDDQEFSAKLTIKTEVKLIVTLTESVEASASLSRQIEIQWNPDNEDLLQDYVFLL